LDVAVLCVAIAIPLVWWAFAPVLTLACVSLDEVVSVTDRNRVLASYRFFGVNDGEKVLWEESIGCLDDDEARAAATSRAATGVSIEVWDVARFVGRCGVSMNVEIKTS
jgi:hypothetical protein